ncbi:MAG: phenylalanine--tRNA ligase subunit beta [Candidatus Omnitrophota bacterium]
MKVTFSWLRDFVDIRLSPEALAEKLTMAGLEVTSLERKEGDVVFEIEVTSNRPDWLSVVGIAREVAAITGKKLASMPVIQLTSSNRLTGKPANRLTINIQDKKDCPLYTAKIIKDVKVGPSPEWLRKRLEGVGCRSINNIVDITNYCLFAWGEPLHAFDLDKVVGQLASTPVSQLNVIIRRAKKGEEIVTIDGIKRILNEEILVIASEDKEKSGKPENQQIGKPIAIAGIMGGKDTQVTEGTKNILLEAAVFNPIIVRRGRQALGLQTDSSYRFERGVDFETAKSASWQAVELIRVLAKGRCLSAKNAGVTKTRNKTVDLSVAAAHKILNVSITALQIKSILYHLGFSVKVISKDRFCVTVPSFRPDVHLEIDLIEEIARIFGFEQIPKTLPRVMPEPLIGRQRDLVSVTKNFLTGLGLHEVVTYSLIDKDLLSHLGLSRQQEAIGILNPLSKEQEILRPTLLASLAQCVAHNLNQKQEYVAIFEVAQVFLKHREEPKEELRLGLALCGSKSFMLNGGFVQDPADFLHLKGILEVLFGRIGVAEYHFSGSAAPSTMDIRVGKEKIGLMTMLTKRALDKFDIKNKEVFLLELSLEKLLSLALPQKKFTALPKYPGIARDISFYLKDTVSIKELLETLKAQGQPWLGSIKIADCYKGKQIPVGYKGLTISCLYRSDERTLTETEITPLHALLVSTLTERFGGKIR